MAWMTQQDLSVHSGKSKEPDIDTLTYWVARLEPLIRAEGEGEIIVVLANRCGTEAEAVYAGTSCVLGIEDGEVKVYGILGRGEEGLLVADTTQPPQSKLVAETNAVMQEDAAQSHHAPALDPNQVAAKKSIGQMPVAQPQERDKESKGLLGGIDALSPVERLSQHPFFSGEAPKSDECLTEISIPAIESQSWPTPISSEVQSPFPSPRGVLQITPVSDWGIVHNDHTPDSASSMVHTPCDEITNLINAPSSSRYTSPSCHKAFCPAN
jgi:hypothetical protein